jgi:hypothetical protein
MQVFQAPGVPPMMGTTILPIIGWIENRSSADRKAADPNNQTNAGSSKSTSSEAERSRFAPGLAFRSSI